MTSYRLPGATFARDAMRPVIASEEDAGTFDGDMPNTTASAIINLGGSMLFLSERRRCEILISGALPSEL